MPGHKNCLKCLVKNLSLDSCMASETTPNMEGEYGSRSFNRGAKIKNTKNHQKNFQKSQDKKNYFPLFDY